MPGAGGDAAGDGLSEGSNGKGTGLRHEAGGAPGIGQRPDFHRAQRLAQTNTGCWPLLRLIIHPC